MARPSLPPLQQLSLTSTGGNLVSWKYSNWEQAGLDEEDRPRKAGPWFQKTPSYEFTGTPSVGSKNPTGDWTNEDTIKLIRYLGNTQGTGTTLFEKAREAYEELEKTTDWSSGLRVEVIPGFVEEFTPLLLRDFYMPVQQSERADVADLLFHIVVRRRTFGLGKQSVGPYATYVLVASPLDPVADVERQAEIDAGMARLAAGVQPDDEDAADAVGAVRWAPEEDGKVNLRPGEVKVQRITSTGPASFTLRRRAYAESALIQVQVQNITPNQADIPPLYSLLFECEVGFRPDIPWIQNAIIQFPVYNLNGLEGPYEFDRLTADQFPPREGAAASALNPADALEERDAKKRKAEEMGLGFGGGPRFWRIE